MVADRMAPVPERRPRRSQWRMRLSLTVAEHLAASEADDWDVDGLSRTLEGMGFEHGVASPDAIWKLGNKAAIGGPSSAKSRTYPSGCASVTARRSSVRAAGTSPRA